MEQAAKSAAAQMPINFSLDDFSFQVYIEVELILSDT